MKSSLRMKVGPLVLTVIVVLWTVICWITYRVVDWLPVLSDYLTEGVAINKISEQTMGMFPLPQSLFDAWIPSLTSMLKFIDGISPFLVNWLGYVVWFIWGGGVVIIFLLSYLMNKFNKYS